MKKLSKLLVLLLSLVMVFAMLGLTACGGDDPGGDSCTSHVDANGDGKCDVCGESVSTVGPEEPEEHKCSKKCTVCGGCLDYECKEEACAKKCGDEPGRTMYEFEAEDDHVILKGGSMGNLGKYREDQYGATETYIGNFNANTGASIKFTINADEDATVNLFVSACKRQAVTIFTNNVAVLVNNVMIDSPSRVPSNGRDTDTWTEFVDVNLGCVEIYKGRNVVELAVMDSGASVGYNINSISISSPAPVSWYEGGHICDSICAVCGGCTNYTCTDGECAEKCECGWTDKVFSAIDDNAVVGGSAFKNTGDGCVGGLDQVGASVTFNIVSPEVTFARLLLNACHRVNEAAFSDAFTLTVNGTSVTSQSAIPTGGTEWTDFDYVDLGFIMLRDGVNIIQFTVKDAAKGCNIKDIKMSCAESLDWYIEVFDYKFEAEAAGGNGWGAGGFSKVNHSAASGGVYVGRVNDVSGSNPGQYYLLFEIYAEAETEAVLYYGLGNPLAINLSSLKLTVNGNDETVNKAIAQGEWEKFAAHEVTTLTLAKGLNTIKITVMASATTNIDYIGFVCEAALSNTSFDIVPHECESVCPDCGGCTNQSCTEDACADKCECAHECESICGDCGKCQDFACDDPVCAEKCDCEMTKYDFDGLDEKVMLAGGAAINTGEQCIGNLNTNMGATVTFKVDAAKKCGAYIYLNVCHRGAGITFNDGFNFYLNGTKYSSSVAMPTGGTEWHTYEYVCVGFFPLEAGLNKLMFEVATSDAGKGYNIKNMAVETVDTAIDWYVHACESVCPDCGKCTDYECNEAVCIDKCEEGWTETVFSGVHGNVLLGDGTAGKMSKGASNLGNVNNNKGATATFEIDADEAGWASISFTISSRAEAFTFNGTYSLTVNGTDIPSDVSLKADVSDWGIYIDVKIGYAELVEGKNVITLTVLTLNAHDIKGITLSSTVALGWFNA